MLFFEIWKYIYIILFTSIIVQVGAILPRHVLDSKHGITVFSKVGLRKTLTDIYWNIKVEIKGCEKNVYLHTVYIKE